MRILAAVFFACAALGQTPSLVITEPASGITVDTGSTVTVVVDASRVPGLTGVMLTGTAVIDELEPLLAPPFRFALRIPDKTTPGPYTLVAYGGNGTSSPARSRAITINVKPQFGAREIWVTPAILELATPGDVGVARVAGHNGSTQLDVTRMATAESENPKIAVPAGTGAVRAVAPGRTRIFYRLGTLEAELEVAVGGATRGDLDGDDDVDEDDRNLLSIELNSAAVAGDARDLNADGKIDAVDVAALTALCSRASCATSTPACTTGLAPGVFNAPAQGSAGAIALTAANGCAWEARSDARWMQIYPLSGAGSINFNATVLPNFSTLTRAATLTVENQVTTVSQSANAGSRTQRLVELLYFNLLGRMPTVAEREFQVTAFNAGLTGTDLAMNFLNSGEFNAGSRFVAGLYVGLLTRDAEYGGWIFQRTALMNSVVNRESIVANFLNSPEYKLRFGDTVAAEFVRLLYRYILLREASPEETAWHAANLAAGMKRTELAQNFLLSEEFSRGTESRLLAFLLPSTLLLRDSSAAERKAFEDRLKSGVPLRTLVAEVLDSNQFAAVLR